MGQLSGGQRIARMLAAEGVEVVFGIIDGTYFGLYSHLRDHEIRLVTPRHETTALHMAGAYARLTGQGRRRDRQQRAGSGQRAARASRWRTARGTGCC